MLAPLLLAALTAAPLQCDGAAPSPGSLNAGLQARLGALHEALSAGAWPDGFDGKARWLAIAITACGDPSLVAQIVRAGAPIDRPDPDYESKTPAALAAQGHAAALQALLDAGASPAEAGLLQEWTPLHYAASQAELAPAKLLLERGADPNALAYDDPGKLVTPLDLANRTRYPGKEQLIALLQQHGARPAPKLAAAAKPVPPGVYGHCFGDAMAVFEIPAGADLAKPIHVWGMSTPPAGKMGDEPSESCDAQALVSGVSGERVFVDSDSCSGTGEPGKLAAVKLAPKARLSFENPAYAKAPYVIDGDPLWVFNRSAAKACAAFKTKAGKFVFGWVDATALR